MTFSKNHLTKIAEKFGINPLNDQGKALNNPKLIELVIQKIDGTQQIEELTKSIEEVVVSAPPTESVVLVQKYIRGYNQKKQYRSVLRKMGDKHQNIVRNAVNIFERAKCIMEDQGPYSLENHYQCALARELRDLYPGADSVQNEITECCTAIDFNGKKYKLDGGCNERVDINVDAGIECDTPTLIELKAVDILSSKCYYQINRYLKENRRAGHQNKVGILINFSTKNRVTMVLTKEGHCQNDIMIHKWEKSFVQKSVSEYFI